MFFRVFLTILGRAVPKSSPRRSLSGSACLSMPLFLRLDFRRADASVPADKAMILKAIEDLDGGLERVEWTVKHLVTDFASFLYASHRAEHPITGEPLSLNEQGGATRRP